MKNLITLIALTAFYACNAHHETIFILNNSDQNIAVQESHYKNKDSFLYKPTKIVKIISNNNGTQFAPAHSNNTSYNFNTDSKYTYTIGYTNDANEFTAIESYNGKNLKNGSNFIIHGKLIKIEKNGSTSENKFTIFLQHKSAQVPAGTPKKLAIHNNGAIDADVIVQKSLFQASDQTWGPLQTIETITPGKAKMIILLPQADQNKYYIFDPKKPDAPDIYTFKELHWNFGMELNCPSRPCKASPELHAAFFKP